MAAHILTERSTRYYPDSQPEPTQNARAEGLSEEIITGLSRFSYLRVIARSSTLQFTGEAVDIRSVGSKLGARYVAIRGEDEIKKGVWTVRDMAGSAQEDVAESRVLDHLKEKIHG